MPLDGWLPWQPNRRCSSVCMCVCVRVDIERLCSRWGLIRKSDESMTHHTSALSLVQRTCMHHGCVHLRTCITMCSLYIHYSLCPVLTCMSLHAGPKFLQNCSVIIEDFLVLQKFSKRTSQLNSMYTGPYSGKSRSGGFDSC